MKLDPKQSAAHAEAGAIATAPEPELQNNSGEKSELVQMFHEVVNLVTALQLEAQSLGQSLDNALLSQRCLASLRETNSELRLAIENLSGLFGKNR
jgi:hypothetical protein